MGKAIARRLRRNPTDAEKLLWSHLRYRQVDGARFRRQAPIGRYVVDFVCFDARLVVELDGGQHMARLDHGTERSDWLGSQGFSVLRFWNNDALQNTDAVLESIRKALKDPPP